MSSGAPSLSAAPHPAVPYRIATTRVVVRAYEVSDAEALESVMLENHERLSEWMPWAWDEPQTLDTRRNLLTYFRKRFDAGEDFTMGMFDGNTGAFLGGTGLHPRDVPDTLEIGYWMAADAVGKGLMQEVAAALTRVALGLGLASRVEIRCDPANLRSRRVPEALGFELERVFAEPADSPLALQLTEVWAVDEACLPGTQVAAYPRPTLADASGSKLPWPT